MIARRLCTALVATSMIVLPVQRAQANNHAALLGGMLLGGIIVNEVNKNKQRQRAATPAPRSSAPSSALREQNRQVQTALNYFGYNVGAVDGVVGRQTRAGISRYQAAMGFQPDGRMDDYERDFLLGSYQRALASANVPPYNNIMATQGPGGLLRTYRNEQLGIATVRPAPAPSPSVQPTTTEPVPARASTATLPSFPIGQTSRSVNESCNQINALTAANGGITTAGRVADAEFALNEQFCLARAYAMSESSSIMATIPNMTEAQIEAQCAGLAQVIAPHVGALGSKQPDQVIAEAAAVLQSSGQPIDQLASAARVCLGTGYRIDDAQMALASAVLLAAAGQRGYGEVVSHQMREGFGVAKATPEQSGAWMSLAINAFDAGGPAVLGQSPDRVAVLKESLAGGGARPGVAALPVFPAPAD